MYCVSCSSQLLKYMTYVLFGEYLKYIVLSYVSLGVNMLYVYCNLCYKLPTKGDKHVFVCARINYFTLLDLKQDIGKRRSRRNSEIQYMKSSLGQGLHLLPWICSFHHRTNKIKSTYFVCRNKNSYIHTCLSTIFACILYIIMLLTLVLLNKLRCHSHF